MDIKWDWKPVLIHFILYQEWAVFDFLTSTFSPYSVFSTNWPSDPFKIDTRSCDFSTENSSMSLTLQTVQARALAKVYRAIRSGLSGLFLTLPCSLYSSSTGHTASQTQTAYSHLWTFALFVPFDRNTLPSDITWLTFFKPLLNSHHLNRQPCPTYLKLYCTPAPHTPSSSLSYSVCPP